MSLISYCKLCELVESGVIDADPANINGASIDITLGNTILVEKHVHEDLWHGDNIIDLSAKENIKMVEIEMDGAGFTIHPDQFILASSVETFNLPNWIAAEYKLKSSMARNGLQHLLAGWCDPGWNNSTLTLELKNVTESNKLLIRPGMKIGQMVFWETRIVPDEFSYAVTGQYNNQTKTTASKGIR